MKKELCFDIEGKKLYLEQVLVDYMDIPIFFLCMDGGEYYVSLCTDIEELNYIIVKAPDSDIYDLLHGKVPMRNVFLNQKEYWEVISGEDVSLDLVTKYTIDCLESSLLPEENACFEALTETIESYIQKFDNKFFSSSSFFASGKKADLDDISYSELCGFLNETVELFVNLGDYVSKSYLERVHESTIELGGDYVSHTMNSVKLQNTHKSEEEKWKNDEIINIAA